MSDLSPAPNGAAPTVKSLVSKLAEVMGEVERVAKHGRNDFHKYDYATESDIVAAVRKAMAERHLILVPDVQDISWRGPDNTICTLKVRFEVIDGEALSTADGPALRTLQFTVYGEGQDKGDKATYKAMTGATKYALLKLFLIPTGDDPEREDGKAATTPPQSRRRTAPAVDPRPGLPPEAIGDPDRPATSPEAFQAESEDALPGPDEIPPAHVIAARFRKGERLCPACKRSTIFKSRDKAEWFCWRKKGGCGSIFPDVPAPAAPAAAPAAGPEDNRDFLTGAIKRKFGEHRFTADEIDAARADYLEARPLEAAHVDHLNKLYVFLGNRDQVNQWRLAYQRQ